MKITGINFMPAMVLANLREIASPGTGKTQTRRLVKPSAWVEDHGEDASGQCVRAGEYVDTRRCPYGQPGDLMYVKEAAWMWCLRRRNGLTPTGRQKWRYEQIDGVPLIYCADRPLKPDFIPDGQSMLVDGHGCLWRKKVARFLPRSASRITLEITGVRVERLQDISEEDAKAEGVEPYDVSMLTPDQIWLLDAPLMDTTTPYKNGFALLWESINGQGSWDANPWVFVITYRPLLVNIYQHIKQMEALK